MDSRHVKLSLQQTILSLYFFDFLCCNLQNFHKEEEVRNLTCYLQINVNIIEQSDRDESCIMHGPRNTQMVFAALARGKQNKKLTVLTIGKRNKELKKLSPFSQNSFSRISIDRDLLYTKDR